jgi:hypothetical protein
MNFPAPPTIFCLLHAAEGCVDGVVTSDLSGSLEGAAGVALGDLVVWYFESVGIRPPYHMASLQNAARKKRGG